MTLFFLKPETKTRIDPQAIKPPHKKSHDNIIFYATKLPNFVLISCEPGAKADAAKLTKFKSIHTYLNVKY